MSTEIQPVNQSGAVDLNNRVAKALKASVEAFEKNWPVINDKVNRNLAALSLITQVTTDEEDKKAEILLTKTRATYETVMNLRFEGTKALDEVKAMAMEPEKKISTDPKAVNEYARIKKLRDAYAKLKLEKYNNEQEKIKKDAAKRNELIRLKTLAEKLFLNLVMDALVLLENSIRDKFAAATLETWELFEKKFNAKPQLKKETFDAVFTQIQPVAGVFTDQEFNDEFLSKVREQFTYERVNGEYAEKGFSIVEAWKAKLPTKKEDLERLDELRKTNAIAAKTEEKRQAETEKAEADARQIQLDAERVQQQDELEQKQNEEKLNAEFERTVAVQQAKPVGGRKTKAAIIECAPEKIVEVFSKVLFACYNSPKFQGHIKSDVPDAYGVPTYTAWADELLKFFANNCAATIEGVRIVEKVGTIAKA